MLERKESTNEDGFSLLEIMIVLFIIALTGTLVPLLFSGALSNLSVSSASKEVAAAIRLAKTESIAKKQTYIFNFDKGSKTYWLTNMEANDSVFNSEINFLSSDGDEDIPLGDIEQNPYKKKKKINKEVNVSIPEETDGLYQIFMYSNGSSSGGKLLFTHLDNNKSYQVVVNKVNGKATAQESSQE